MWTKIKEWYRKSSLFKGEVYAIHMRSGNVIILDRVHELKWTYNTGDGLITRLSVEQSPKARTKLLVTTIQLDQIEAITREK